MSSMVIVMPSMVSLIADGWVMRDIFCYLSQYLKWHAAASAAIFICMMTTSKLLMIQYPFRTRIWSRKRAHILCFINWIFWTWPVIIMLNEDKDYIYFTYIIYLCAYRIKTELMKLTLRIYFAFASTASIIVFVTTVMLLVKARKVVERGGKSLRWQGIITVVLTAVVYFVSIIPTTVYFTAIYPFLKDQANPTLSAAHFSRVAHFLLQLNIMSNFYIYTLTVSSFREFISSKIQLIASYFHFPRVLNQVHPSGARDGVTRRQSPPQIQEEQQMQLQQGIMINVHPANMFIDLDSEEQKHNIRVQRQQITWNIELDSRQYCFTQYHAQQPASTYQHSHSRVILVTGLILLSFRAQVWAGASLPFSSFFEIVRVEIL